MADAQEYVGQVIGNYRLLRLIGEGMFGNVYLAEHLHNHTHVAMKLWHHPLTDRKNWHAFLNEARAVSLHHPYIVPILDFGLTRGDLPYLVMAYVGGGTLRDRYPVGSKLSIETIDAFVQQLASALQYAHDHQIIHRDVKPENILVQTDGTVQLSDFGIAKICEHAGQSTVYKIAGTPAYTAPEQSQGQPCPASDQYALAIVVYEWLSGQVPFQGNPLAVIWHHHTGVPPSLHDTSPAVSSQVEQVIFKALAKAPEERFPTITHFAEALHIALQGALLVQPPSNLNQFPTGPASMIPDSLSGVAPPVVFSASMSLTPANISLPPQSIIMSPSSVEIPDRRSFAILQLPSSAPGLQKRSSMKQRLRVLALFVCLALLLGGVAWIVGTHSFKTSVTPTPTITASFTPTPTINTSFTSVADFTVSPVALQNLTLETNDSTFDQNHSFLGYGGQVVVEFDRKENMKTVSVTVKGLVSRFEPNAGSAPINLLCNGTAFLQNFSEPGEGYDPNTSTFQVPAQLLTQGTNQITLQTVPGGKTYFWLYRLEVDQSV